MKNRFLIACLLTFAACTQVNAADCITKPDGKVVCGQGQCAEDQYGKVFCAREGGGAMKDRDGKVKCGVGYCATDDQARTQCSTRPGGGAERDSKGKVTCLGGCKRATAQLCEAAR